VTLDGTVTPVATITSPDRIRETPAVAHANGETVVVWSELNRCGYAGSQIVARSLIANHDLRLTSGPAAQWDPAIAAGPANALIAWAERAGGSRIRARFYPFTEPAFDISSGPGSSTPVVATDGSGGYLVFLDDDLTVVGRRPDLEYNAAIAETPAGLAEVYQRADTVFLDWPHRRRRTLR
jgi:hypothetical protein